MPTPAARSGLRDPAFWHARALQVGAIRSKNTRKGMIRARKQAPAKFA